MRNRNRVGCHDEIDSRVHSSRRERMARFASLSSAMSDQPVPHALGFLARQELRTLARSWRGLKGLAT